MNKYQKDFAGWAKVAERLQRRGAEEEPELKVGAIYWANFGVNIGTVVDGKGRDFTRPALVLTYACGGQVLVLPLTTKAKSGPNAQKVIVAGRIEYLLFAQARPLDWRCMGDFIDELSPDVLLRVKRMYLKYLRLMLGLIRQNDSD